jgi:UDPglucose 6-dehydrogenase
VIDANENRKEAMAQRVIHACGGSVAGKTLAILGVTFKPNTDDMRDSPSLVIIPTLQKAGAEVRAFDPEGMKEAAKLVDNVAFCANAYEAMEGADALVIVTEWNEFRALDLGRVMNLLRTPTVIDLRNIYKPEDMSAAGFYYVSVGRAPVEPSATRERRQAIGTTR